MRRSALVAVWLGLGLCLLAADARAQGFFDDSLPADEGAPTSSVVMLANEILDYTPLLAGLLGMVVLLALHAWKTKEAARTWRGQPGGFVTFWGMPILVSLLVYIGSCAAVLIFAILSSADFLVHLRMHFSLLSAFLWVVVGTSIVLAPALVRLVIR